MRTAMQRWWLGLFVAGVVVAVLAEPKAQPAPASEDVLVLEADQALGEALRAGDKSIARWLLALQFTFVDENGKIHERKEFLNGLKNVAAASATDVKVKIYGAVAMVTGRRRSALGGDPFFLDIWARQKGAWRVLAMQDVVLAAADAPADPPAEAPDDIAKIFDCKNPCQAIPYRVRSPAEQDIVNAFEAMQKATVAHNADEYGKYLADEFVHYESGYPPIPKSERLANVENKKKHNIPATLPAIQTMRLWVYGDGAAMISANGVPDDTEPLLRIARVWVKRNGRWQMAISVQTEVK